MLNVIMQNIIMLSVIMMKNIMLNVNKLIINMLIVIMLNAIMLTVVAPNWDMPVNPTFSKLGRRSSTVVEDSPRHRKVEGLSPTTAANKGLKL